MEKLRELKKEVKSDESIEKQKKLGSGLKKKYF
jgi:hypothetical protein